jgi:hypothetical protein
VTYKTHDQPSLAAHFEQADDGSITFVFKIIGLRNTDEADRLAECMRTPINRGFAAFFGFSDEMVAGDTIH